MLAYASNSKSTTTVYWHKARKELMWAVKVPSQNMMLWVDISKQLQLDWFSIEEEIPRKCANCPNKEEY